MPTKFEEQNLKMAFENTFMELFICLLLENGWISVFAKTTALISDTGVLLITA